MKWIYLYLLSCFQSVTDALSRIVLFVFSIMCVFAITTSNTLANPINGQVTVGDATITNPSANVVQVHQTSEKAIINWQSFNIGAHEKTQFLQPGASSVALNRIDPTQGVSQIFGNLTANGQIILINQVGIFFGSGAIINVCGIIASTSDITNQNFLDGKYIFDQPSAYSGSIVNQGTIIAAENGLVALIGTGVSNEGLIIAHLGSVILAAGNKFTITFSDNHLISFIVDGAATSAGVDQNGKALKNSVSNSGQIIANGGRILITAKTASDVLDSAINMSGVAQALSVSEHKGEIILSADINSGIVHVSGILDVSGKNTGEKGGKVIITGSTIIIDAPAVINASGDVGGGEVLIGGDYQGKNTAIQNAERVFFSSTANVYADALTTGNGGKVIVWSNDDTRLYGNIFARGGLQDGNGGFIEVSGENLDFNGFVDASAPNGITGTLLLDPKFLIVQTLGGSTYSNSVNNLFANNPSGTNIITPASLVAAAANIILQANTDVTFNDVVALTSGGKTLTVNAGRSILINANISTNNGLISLTANDTNAGSATTSSNRDVGAANITMASGTTLSAGNKAITLTINPTATSNGVPFTAGDMTLYGVTLGANSTWSAPNAVNINGVISNAGTLTINANTSAGSGNVTFNNGGSIIASNKTVTITVNTNVASGGTGSIQLNNTAGTNINTGGAALILRTTGGGIINTSGGSITQIGSNNTIDTGGNNITLQVPSSGLSSIGTNTQNLMTTSAAFTLALRAGSGGAFVNNVGNLTLGTPSLNANSPISVISSGVITLPNFAFNTGTGNITFISNGGILNLANTLTTSTGNITLSASGLLTADKNLTTSGGNILLTGVGVTNAAANNIIFNSGSGNITVDSGTTGLTVNSGSQYLSTGIITLTGDAIALNTTATPSQIGGSGTGVGLASSVIIQPKTPGTIINIGTGTTGVALSTAETNDIRATNVQIGNNNAGLLTITAWTPVASFASGGLLTLQTGSGGITQSGAIDLTASLSSLTATTSGVLNSNAITTTNKNVSLTGVGVTQAASTNITTGTRNITINSGTGTLTLSTNSLLLAGNASGTASTITLTGDTMIFNAGSQVGGTGSGTGSAQTVIVQPNTSGRTIGIAGGTGSLALSTAALNSIRATNVRIGNSIAGTITIGTASTTWTPAATFASSLLTLDSAGTITQTALAPINLGTRSLLLRDSNNVALTNSSNVFTNIAATLTGPMQLSSNNALIVSGITDDLGLVNGITTSGNITLTSNNTLSESGSAFIHALLLTTSSVGGTTLNNANTISSFNATNTGSGNIALTNSGTLSIAGITQPVGNLMITNIGVISQTAALTVSGTSSFNAGANAITLTQSNAFTGAVSLSNSGSNNATINNNINLTLGTSNVGGKLTATSLGAITLNGSLTANASGDSIVLSGNQFNNSGSFSLNPGVGRFLVWSSNANPFSGGTPDNRGGLTYNFKQYNASYGVTTVLGSGNGFLYTYAPTITPVLTGTVTKSYNATTVATLAGTNYSNSGAVDGDTVTLNNPTTGSYDTKNVGLSKNVSVSGIAITSATNGSATVYGYQVTTTANANIGVITAAPITISSNAGQTKVYGNNDPLSAETAYSLTSGTLFGSDSLSGNMGRAVGETVGAYNFTQNTTTISDGNSGSNYAITFNGTTNKFQITARALTASIVNQTQVYGANDPTLSSINVTLNNVVNANVTDINGNVTAINNTGNVATTLSSLTRSVGENVAAYNITAAAFNTLTGSAANNYSAPSGLTGSPTLTISKANLTALVANQNEVYGASDPALASIGVTLTGLINNPTVYTWNGNVAINDSALTSSVTALTRAIGESVGTYNITAGTFSAASGNYNAPTFTGSPNLTISQASLTATIANQNKIYGANDPTLSGINVTLIGLINNPTVVTWNGNVSINDSGLTESLSSLTRAAGENIGVYNINGATLTATFSNYSAPTVVGTSTLTITQASLTGSIADQSKVYGQSDPSLLSIPVILSGVINNPTVVTWNGNVAINDIGNVNTSLASLTRAPGENVNGSPYAYTSAIYNALTGSAAANYSTPPNSLGGSPTLTITPAMLTASLTGSVTKIYDATTAATLAAGNYQLSGVLGSDVVNLNNPINGLYSNANVGTGINVVVSGLAISGTSASNYQLVATSANADIGIILPAINPTPPAPIPTSASAPLVSIVTPSRIDNILNIMNNTNFITYPINNDIANISITNSADYSTNGNNAAIGNATMGSIENILFNNSAQNLITNDISNRLELSKRMPFYLSMENALLDDFKLQYGIIGSLSKYVNIGFENLAALISSANTSSDSHDLITISTMEGILLVTLLSAMYWLTWRKNNILENLKTAGYGHFKGAIFIDPLNSIIPTKYIITNNHSVNKTDHHDVTSDDIA